MPLPASYGPPVGHVPDISENNKVEYGAYLAGPVAHCTLCHTSWGEEDKEIMKFFMNPPIIRIFNTSWSWSWRNENGGGPLGESQKLPTLPATQPLLAGTLMKK
ncbi:MAG: hypothetical protein Ct9H300mP28_22710 [Pseudomonadota bacterium]|nr:MAG: hypothetical protein Ct9H300mP28_22710 [Pseudomonadota bacterium]